MGDLDWSKRPWPRSPAEKIRIRAMLDDYVANHACRYPTPEYDYDWSADQLFHHFSPVEVITLDYYGEFDGHK